MRRFLTTLILTLFLGGCATAGSTTSDYEHAVNMCFRKQHTVLGSAGVLLQSLNEPDRYLDAIGTKWDTFDTEMWERNYGVPPSTIEEFVSLLRKDRDTREKAWMELYEYTNYGRPDGPLPSGPAGEILAEIDKSDPYIQECAKQRVEDLENTDVDYPDSIYWDPYP